MDEIHSKTYRFSYAFRYYSYSSELPRRGCEIHRSRPGRNLAYVVYWTIHKPISQISQVPAVIYSLLLLRLLASKLVLSSSASSFGCGLYWLRLGSKPIPQLRPTLAEVPKAQPYPIPPKNLHNSWRINLPRSLVFNGLALADTPFCSILYV